MPAARADPKRIYAHLLTLLPHARTAPLCVAFSGGEDSTALLGLLATQQALVPRLRALHLDHGLQAASAAWVRHCRATCRTLKVPFTSQRLALRRRRGESLEALARTARYAAFAAALAPGEVLLTAHHLEDQLETVLLQLLRGAGLAGLAAMPAVAPLGPGYLVRPLLNVSRAQLREWLAAHGLRGIEDPSNADVTFDRNYLRHELLPRIIQRWPGAATAVARSAGHVAAALALLDEQASADVARAADGAALSAAALRALPLARRRNALRYWIRRAGHEVPDARRLEQIAVTLLAARPDAHPRVRFGDLEVGRHAGLVYLGTPREAAAYELDWDLTRQHELILPNGAGTLRLVAAARGKIDAAALPSKLTVRTRRGGERLRPRPGGPSRTLKSLLQSESISLSERAQVPLLYAAGELVAAADLWVDARWQAQGANAAQRLTLIWHRPA